MTTFHERIRIIKDLIEKRDEIERRLAEIIGGDATVRRANKCSRCGQEGHTAKTCVVAGVGTPPTSTPDQV